MRPDDSVGTHLLRDRNRSGATVRRALAMTGSAPHRRHARATPSRRRLKVLVSAYACVPGEGSEHGVGWNLATTLAEHHDVWLLTKPRASIAAALAERPVPNLTLVPYDLPRSLRWIRDRDWVPLYYYLWQLGAIPSARRAHAEIGFDLAHHVTFVKYAAPAAAAFAGAPFVWGPVGGGESMPRPFLQRLSLRARAFEHARHLARRLGELDPLVRATARRSRLAIATTPETAARLRRLVESEVVQLPDVALGAAELELLEPRDGTAPRDGAVTFVSVGRLVGWKGYHLSIEAFARAYLPRARYLVIGSGPERENLERLAAALGVHERIAFLGDRPRSEVLERVRAADVFVHPSLHDSGGWATVEAMAAGTPVVCLDLGGSGVQVTAQTGIKVAPTDPASAVTAMAEALTRLAGDRRLRERLGAGGRERVREAFTWHGRVRALSALYDGVVGDRHDR